MDPALFVVGAGRSVGQAAMGHAQQRSTRLMIDQVNLDQARPGRHLFAVVPPEAVGEAVDRNDLGKLAAGGAKLIADDLPLAGGALTLAAPHPMISRRTWLWRAETGVVIEALGFGALGSAGPGQSDVGRDWLTRLGGAVVQDVAGPASDGPMLGWSILRPLTEQESALLHQAARFAAAPLAVLATRSTLAALLEAYLGRRSAAQVLAGRLRRQTGETIRAVLLYGDLRDFTALSEAMAPEAVVTALDAWFDRIAGAVHAFGGEVMKFIGDGVLAIFPIGERSPSA